MLRPEQMSKLSVTGSKAVMDDVVDAIHEQHRVHLSDYDGSWEGFAPGDPVAGADEASEKLVTVRSLESILGVDDEDAGPTRLVTDEAIETELEEVRQRVNELDDRRDDIRDELRTVRDRQEAIEPFADLGIDLDLLSGYDTLQVVVVEGEEAAIRETLVAADEVRQFELFTGDGVVAAFGRPTEGAGDDALQEALVGTNATQLEVPDVEDVADDHGGQLTPQDYIDELEHREQTLKSKLESVESELEDVKLDAAGFLLAVEEKLTIDVQKREAPLSFATTDHAFVAEGWVPTDAYPAVAEAVSDAVGGRVEVEELERVDYEEYSEGHAPAHGGDEEPADDEGPAGPTPTTDDGSGEVAADGGTLTMSDEPPVVLDNPAAASPFELLVEAVDLPRYDEWDPTVLLWLTFPAFFGFMIGDLGYGLLYTAIGYYLWTRMDSQGLRALGGVAMWAGGFTMLFGILYGEVFGLHQLGELYGGPVVHKGLQPHYIAYAKAWILVTALAGVLHLTVGYVLSFGRQLQAHGPGEAVLESGSWVLMLFGLWGFLFSGALAGPKPAFLVGSGSAFNGNPLPLGFTGLPATVGWVGVGAFVVGLAMIFYADWVEGVEAIFLKVFVNGLSYTRIAAVLLAKAGMAFIVNLLVFGAYAHDGEFHFIFFAEPGSYKQQWVIFSGLVNAEGAVGLAVGWLAGILVLLIGHAAVLGLGVTSAGLQAVRLEYVEFFDKFYEGGGERYEPFGYEREFTTED